VVTTASATRSVADQLVINREQQDPGNGQEFNAAIKGAGDADASGRKPEFRLAQADTTANHPIQTDNAAASGVVSKRGLDSVGDRYYAAGLLDDSHAHLLSAEVEEKNGHLQLAAQIRQVILNDRLTALHEKLPK
jgi:hypothetical protein